MNRSCCVSRVTCARTLTCPACNTSLWFANGYGGLSAATAKELGRCDAIAKDKKVNDTTHYGTGAAATSSYICHHTRRISNAIVASDARCIENAFAMRAAASSEMFSCFLRSSSRHAVLRSALHWAPSPMGRSAL